MKKKIFDEHGATLVELMTAFLILLLASQAVLFSISGYARAMRRYKEIYAAQNRLEREAGSSENGEMAEIHLEIGGEGFVEPGIRATETAGDDSLFISGFWVDEAVVKELFADEEE